MVDEWDLWYCYLTDSHRINIRSSCLHQWRSPGPKVGSLKDYLYICPPNIYLFSYEFSHIEFHWATTTTGLGSEHSIDGTKAAMEMHVVHHKTHRTVAQETAAVVIPGGIGYSAAVLAATATPVDPAHIAVIAYQIDVSFFISPFTQYGMQIDMPLFRLEPKTLSCWHSQMN